jgi:hypothetical protein
MGTISQEGSAMSIVRRAFWAAAAGLALAVSLMAQDKKDAESAAPAGEEITGGFRAYIVAEPRFGKEDVRNRTSKMQDLVTDHALEPTIAVFSRTIPPDIVQPLAFVIKKLDALQEMKEYKAKRLGAFVVFLALKDEFRKDETRDARLREIEQFVSALMPKHTTIGLAEATETPDGTNNPLVPAQVQKMGIGAEDDLVIVFYDKFHVIKRWKFPASKGPTEEDLKELEAVVAKTLGVKK